MTVKSAVRRAVISSNISEILRSRPLWIALIAGLLLRVVFLIWTPFEGESHAGRLSAYNDELAHAKYVYHIVHHRELPSHVESIQESGAIHRGTYEYYQPAMYYVALAGIADAFSCRSLPQIILLGRIGNILLFVGLLWIYIILCRSLRVSNAAIGSGLIFLSLNGVFVRFTSLVTNDVLFWLLIGGVLAVLIRLREYPKSPRLLVIYSCLAVAALYTKLTALLAIPLLFAVIPRRRVRMVFAWYAGALLLIFLATLPIWFRNLIEFGSWLPLSAGFGDGVWRFPDYSFLRYAGRSLFFPWSEFWQGYLGLPLLLVPAIWFINEILIGRSWKILISSRILLWCGILTLCAFLWLNLRYDQAEARYVFAAWPAIGLLCTAGIQTTRRQWSLLFMLLLPYLLFFLSAFRSQFA